MVDLNMLNTAIKESGLRRDYIADRLGITRVSLYNKLEGVTEFTASELAGMKDVLHLTQAVFRRIFFASESELNSLIK